MVSNNEITKLVIGISIGVIALLILVYFIITFSQGNKSMDQLADNSKSEYIHTTDHQPESIDYNHMLYPNLAKNLPQEWSWKNISLEQSLFWSNIVLTEPGSVNKFLPSGNYSGNVQNQHVPVTCSSCFIYASVSVLEDRYNILRAVQAGYQLPDLQLSVQHVLNGLALTQDRNPCFEGGHPSNVFKLIEKYGIPDQSCNPYVSTPEPEMFKEPYCFTNPPVGMTCDDIKMESFCNNDAKDALDKMCCGIKDHKTYGIEEHHNIITNESENHDQRVLDAKLEIFLHGPITASIYSKPIEFLDNNGIVGSGICINNSSNQKSDWRNDVDHIIEIVGWKIIIDEETGEDLQYWHIKNSWGTYWGDNGYAYVPIKGDCLNILDFGFQVAYPIGWSSINPFTVL